VDSGKLSTAQSLAINERIKTMKRKKAVALTTAGYDKRHHKAYRKVPPMSRFSLKDQIGLLLWFLCRPVSQQQSAAGYRLLEVLLLQSYQESRQSPSHGRDMAVEATKS